MAGKYKSATEYINLQNEPARLKLLELKELIYNVVPEAEELMNYGVPAYALVKGGKADKQILIGAFKNHVGLYPHPDTIEKFSDELKIYKQGKGSIQFSYEELLPRELIMKMIKYRYEVIINE